MIQEDEDQLVLRDVLLGLKTSHLNHVFGTSHG